MPLYIEARLKSGATMTADYDADDHRMVVRSIKGNAAMAEILVQRAVEGGLVTAESAGSPDQAIRAVCPHLFISANNIGGLKSGSGMELRFSRSFNGEPAWKDTVKSLTVGVGPYMA